MGTAHKRKAERKAMENRELSWLRFNERIVDEADDPANPLLERAKFLAIVTSNMDEFLQVRYQRIYEGRTDEEKGLGGVIIWELNHDRKNLLLPCLSTVT